jgi:hypothetical protein
VNGGQILKNSKQNGFYPIPPASNSNTNRLRPNQRGGWTIADRESVSSDRIPSASLKVSRASSRNSFASEDLEKYMTPNNKPVPQPRLTPSTNRQPSASNRMLSGRSQDSAFPQIYDPPPPVKPRKSSMRNGSNQDNNNNEDIDNHRHSEFLKGSSNFLYYSIF